MFQFPPFAPPAYGIGGAHPARLSTPWRPIADQVARAKDGKNPYQGRIVNLKPRAYERSEPINAGTFGIPPRGDGVPFA